MYFNKRRYGKRQKKWQEKEMKKIFVDCNPVIQYIF